MDAITRRAVTENSIARRFELIIDEDAVASVKYEVEDGFVVLTHTVIPMGYSGQGFASRLAKGTFDLLRATRRRAVLQCPFLEAFFARHAEYSDIVANT